MLNKKFLSLSLVLGFMFVSVSAFASNLTERNVYGILSENFTGAEFTNGRSEDNINKWCDSSYGDWNAAAAVEISSYTANAKEGKKYWEIVLEKWDSVAEDFPDDYGTCVAFYFIGSDNTTARPKNLTHFKYLDFWVKPNTGDITKVLVGMTTQGSADSCVALGTLGITNSDTWQRVTLDITTLPNIDLTNIKNCLTIKGNNSLSGNTSFYIDNVVLRTDSNSASFKATLKKIETEPWAPENPTQLTWDDDAISLARKSEDVSPWWPCGQYVELDMDMYSWKWTVRVYSNNGASGRGGMYAVAGGIDYVVPMCWRAYNGTLTEGPNGDTYIIEENGDALYDHGVGPNFFPWMYMKDIADVDFDDPKDVDYITVWDSSLGYHGFSSENPWEGFYAFMERVTDDWYRPCVEKKPKLYFGGRFKDAGGGVTYTGNIVIELNYE